MSRREHKKEQAMAREYNLTPTPRSGSGWLQPEDAYNENILAQIKRTEGKSISISLQDVLQLMENAAIEKKTPVFLVRFGTKEGIEVDLVCVQPQHLRVVADSLFYGKSEPENF